MSAVNLQSVIEPSALRAISLSTSILTSIRHHCQHEYPHEACGLLLGYRDGAQVSVSRVVAGRNIADGDRSRRYQIDWRTLFNTIRLTRASGEAIVGFYHSHPDCEPTPSHTDSAAAWLDHVYLIEPVLRGVAGEAAAWSMSNPHGTFESVVIEQG